MENNSNINKKNKIISIIIFLSIIIFVIAWFYKYNKNTSIDTNKISETIIESWSLKSNKETKEIKEINKNNKINNFKKNLASKWLIIKWDIHLKNDEYIFALKKFLEANKQTPNNPKVISKIAETYFLMKNYNQAFKYYSKLENEKHTDKENKALSFLYSKKIENFNFIKNSSGSLNSSWSILIDNIKQEIKKLNLEKEEEFYYSNTLDCIKSFHICKQNFEDYFKNENYSGKYKNLENIRNSINNYNQLKLEELYYKNTLITWAFLQNKNYPIAIILGKELLKEKKNYKPLLKIIAQSYFELNELDKASEYLLEYAKIDSKSPDISYMIWVIAQKKKDYLKSNIFLNIAIKQGYYDLESIYRLQLYNYLILGQEEKISKTFDRIINNQDKPEFSDLVLWTYYNIINNNLEKAWLLANMWIKLYPKKEDFYWFKSWILIEKWEFEEASTLLKTASEINPRNALVVLNEWRIFKKKYETDKKVFYKAKAKFLFEKTIEFDSAEIWNLAKKYLKELEEEKSVE